MIANLELTHKVDQPPCQCLICGGRPHQEGDEPENLPPMVFVPGMDVNWGESVYFCHECVGIMGGLFGMISIEDAAELERENKRLLNENAQLAAKHRKHVKRTRAIVAGEKAKREL